MYLTTSPLNRMFTDLFKDLDWSAQDGVAASWVPPVDVREADDTIQISAELPGVKPEDVKISVAGKVLTVQGTKQQETEQRTERLHRYERTYGSFARTFTLPATVDTEQIKAGFDNGVLTITLPKAAQAKPRQIALEVAKQS